MQWKDETSYSRDDKQRVANVWAIRFKGFRVVVVKNHRLCPKKWVMHCSALGIDTLDLCIESTHPKEIAQNLAIRHIKTRLNSMINELNQYFHSQKLKGNKQTINQ